MSDYIQLIFQPVTSQQSEQLIAELNEIGFEGFEEADDCLKAFIPEGDFDEGKIKTIPGSEGLAYTKSVIKETNWNHVWESNFDPVIVDDFVAVRASFHEPVSSVEQEIVITPKMSFGTGHHATTFMMMQQMRGIPFTNKKVFDFGTGTGVLAILAARLGAAEVLAIDNDDWSIANAGENIENNKSAGIRLEKADDATGEGCFDIILANINKNVILANLRVLVNRLIPGGQLVLSGLLVADEPDILAALQEQGLRVISRRERHNWLCLSASY
ncbi:MAG: 50S ribosomal protein L11 methyltransferase [Chitinophagaceae bacterium]|nr:MAG: 50S ribosomal protein L11 methyltransferase [Chitinophagaceae bacterium]